MVVPACLECHTRRFDLITLRTIFHLHFAELNMATNGKAEIDPKITAYLGMTEHSNRKPSH